jgi:hypothetical protein
MDEVHATRRGHLAFKGEAEGEAWTLARRLEHLEVVFFASKTPHLIPLPSARGEATKRPHASICGARFNKK